MWKRCLILSVNQLNLAKPITMETKFLHITDIEKLHHYSCTNKFCFFGTNDLQKYRVHENYCRKEPLITYKQEMKAKPTENVAKELHEEGFIPTENFFNLFFVVYDIECLMTEPDEDSNKSILSIHTLASIALKVGLKIFSLFYMHNQLWLNSDIIFW